MKFLLLTSIILSVLPLRLEAQSAIESYAAGLVAEKVEGDLTGAIAHYREVLQQYRTGQTSSALAFRARERLSVLGEDPTLESPLPPRLPFQTLGDQFGVTTDDRLTPSGRSADGIGIIGFPLRSRYAVGGKIDIPPSDVAFQDPEFFKAINRQLRALRYALGVTGLLEYVEELAENSRRSRNPDPHELYQAGLIAERQEGDFKEASALYDRALAQAIDLSLHHQIDRRLARCRERLARRGGPALEP